VDQLGHVIFVKDSAGLLSVRVDVVDRYLRKTSTRDINEFHGRRLRNLRDELP